LRRGNFNIRNVHERKDLEAGKKAKITEGGSVLQGANIKRKNVGEETKAGVGRT